MCVSLLLIFSSLPDRRDYKEDTVVYDDLNGTFTSCSKTLGKDSRLSLFPEFKLNFLHKKMKGERNV